MSDKTRRELSFVAEALDGVDPTPEEIAGTTSRLPMTVGAWAEEIRKKIGAADDADRQARFETGRRGYRAASQALARRNAEPVRPLPEAQVLLRELIARAPPSVSANFLKFENATPEQLADMIGALRHLLGEDET